MYLTKKVKVKVSKDDSIVLNDMRYSAYKLWNVGNYEKRNYKELGFDKFPDWYSQKKRLKENFFYKNLPSQTSQDILQRLEEGWKSYFVLLETKGQENPKPPRFKHDLMDITFKKDAIKHKDNKIRLTISKQLKEYLKRKKNINANYLYIENEEFSNICIKELELKFDKNFNKVRELIVLIVYEIEDVEVKEDNQHYLSIDLGIKNNFTCYDSKGKSFIVNGFLNATHYYDKKIAYYQSVNSNQQYAKGIEYPKSSKRILKLYEKKRNTIKDFLHKSTTYIAKYCEENEINTVVIGDLKNIRKDRDIGRNNQQLHSLPYNKIYEMLEYKLALRGIRLIKIKESYSSQCSPKSKRVAKRYAKKSNRKHRGLYVEDGIIYNADSVGSYNILRIYLEKMGIDKKCMKLKGLSNPKKIIKVAV